MNVSAEIIGSCCCYEIGNHGDKVDLPRISGVTCVIKKNESFTHEVRG